jgi:hypothetical protein
VHLECYHCHVGWRKETSSFVSSCIMFFTEGVMWEPSRGTSHRLPKPVYRKQLINRVTNNRIAQEGPLQAPNNASCVFTERVKKANTIYNRVLIVGGSPGRLAQLLTVIEREWLHFSKSWSSLLIAKDKSY